MTSLSIHTNNLLGTHDLNTRLRVGSRSKEGVTRRNIFKAYQTWENLYLSRGYSLFGVDRFLAITRIALSQLFGADHSLTVARIDLSRSLDSLSCGYSSWIALSQLLGVDRSLAVARIDLSRSLNSLYCSYSAQIALLQLLVMDSSLALLGTDRSLTVTCHRSLSRSYSARIALSQSLGLLASFEHDVIPRRHVHPWRFDCDVSLMANTVLTDRSRNQPGVRSLIGIRSMSMTARPRRSVYDTSSMAT
ncbi:hypothetical protein F2Q69_00002608 [Brassica cretica]|uniref:Uncharacterized protein n=1 Tax=Brassica cretica TaxID=69181 RepID=A0A8S9PGM0_BRACR|nr:hypothetical protein F2Q69_00002608 [Brassica cretica]